MEIKKKYMYILWKIKLRKTIDKKKLKNKFWKKNFEKKNVSQNKSVRHYLCLASSPGQERGERESVIKKSAYANCASALIWNGQFRARNFNEVGRKKSFSLHMHAKPSFAHRLETAKMASSRTSAQNNDPRAQKMALGSKIIALGWNVF